MIVKISKRPECRNLYHHLFSTPRKLFPEGCRMELTQEMMQKADVDPTLRPTELTIPQFRALVDAYAHLCIQEPSLLSYEHREELRLMRLQSHGNTLVNTFTPPSPLQPCWGEREKKIKKETWRIPLMASVIRRQQTALSRDISTWHKHAFLKCFSLCSGSISYLLVYMQSWGRDKDQKAHKESWVCWSSSRTMFQDGTAQRRVVCFGQNEESMLVTHNSFFLRVCVSLCPSSYSDSALITPCPVGPERNVRVFSGWFREGEQHGSTISRPISPFVMYCIA